MLIPAPLCAEQAPLAKESLQTGKPQLLANEATAAVSTRCHRTSKHGLQTGHPQHLPHVSSRITRGREERGLIPSTAVQSLPSEHPLACTSQAHPRIHTGVSHTNFLERPSGAPVCSITQLTPPEVCVHWLRWLHCAHPVPLTLRAHTLRGPSCTPQGHPYSRAGVIIGVPQRLTRLGA